MTQAGVILGTAASMSPEQARGQTVDTRADIWAFGVQLWEMLTGRRLFEASSATEVLAPVLRGEIDLEAVPDGDRGIVAVTIDGEGSQAELPVRVVAGWTTRLESP